jgi:hypothetical protein
MESLSRWQVLSANKIPSVEFCAGIMATGATAVSVCPFIVDLDKQKTLPPFGRQGVNLFVQLVILALLPVKPGYGNAQVFVAAGAGGGKRNASQSPTDGVDLWQTHLAMAQHHCAGKLI